MNVCGRRLVMSAAVAVLAACCPSPSAPVTEPPAASVEDRAAPSDVTPSAEDVTDRDGPAVLTFIDDHNFAGDIDIDGLRFGGISALAYDPQSARLMALSDAHKAHAPARMFSVYVRLDDRELAARVTGVVRLTGAFDGGLLDPEGLAPSPDGGWVISTEGDGERVPRTAPAIYTVDRQGRSVRRFPMHERYTPTAEGELTHGVTHNKGLEGLTAAPSGNVYFAITEAPIAQDGEHASFERGAHLRLTRLNRELQVVAEHHYLTEPVPRLAEGKVEKAQNGISALCALGDDRVLVMERAAVKADGTYQNRVQIFEITVAGAADVESVDDLRTAPPPLAKRLVLDLDDVVPQFEEGHRSLDNFEGMALGPILPSGRRSVLMVSDDNFKAIQRTVLLAFVLKTSPLGSEAHR